MKFLLILAIASILLYGCIEIVKEQPVISNITNVTTYVNLSMQDLNQPEEEQIIVYQSEGFRPESIQERSIVVTLESIEERIIDDEEIIYFVIQTEDLIKDKQESLNVGNFQVREPTRWYGTLLFTLNDHIIFSRCQEESNESIWKIGFCINKKDINPYYFDQTLRFVYSIKNPTDYKSNDLRGLDSLPYTYIFKVKVPFEFKS